MDKSQLNIKISKELLYKVKRHAMISGKSLTEHITDLISNSLAENVILDAGNKLNDFEERLLIIESLVRSREYLNQKLDPFTNSEAINCTKFMRGVFDKEVEKRNFKNKKDAFDDFYKHIKNYDQLSYFFIVRLKEVMLSDNPNPWTGKELNDLTGENKCNCSIRKGLIKWTGKTHCPSQQEICDKGEKLLPSF